MPSRPVIKKGSRTNIKLPEKPKNTYSKNNKLLTEENVARLAEIHCTMAEIAAWCNCSVDVLERRFAEVIKKGREKGKISLRRAQVQKAEEGNPTMLIWCGKHMLNQREVVEVTNHKTDVETVLEHIKALDPIQKTEEVE